METNTLAQNPIVVPTQQAENKAIFIPKNHKKPVVTLKPQRNSSLPMLCGASIVLSGVGAYFFQDTIFSFFSDNSKKIHDSQTSNPDTHARWKYLVGAAALILGVGGSIRAFSKCKHRKLLLGLIDQLSKESNNQSHMYLGVFRTAPDGGNRIDRMQASLLSDPSQLSSTFRTENDNISLIKGYTRDYYKHGGNDQGIESTALPTLLKQVAITSSTNMTASALRIAFPSIRTVRFMPGDRSPSCCSRIKLWREERQLRRDMVSGRRSTKSGASSSP